MTSRADPTDERRLALERRLAELSPAKRALLERGALDASTHLHPGSAVATISRRAPGVPVPMSFAQELIWTLERTNPGHAYNLSRLSRLKGALDPPALQRALDALVTRHEVLRTTFAEVDGEPRQVIHEPCPVPISRVDLTAIPEADREHEAVRRVRELTRRPFDLATDLQLRCTLLQLAAEDHVLLLESHHVATDGWSRSILLRELTALYDGFRTGNHVALPDLAIQYGDYALWQRETLRGEVLERLLAYWRTQLAGAPPMLELPADRPRPLGPSFDGAKRTLWLPTSLLEQLRALSQANGVTLFMTLLAAFDVLLARYSGENDILVGSPVAGRTHPETHGVMGYFINTLVLRTSLAGDPTVTELLGRVRDVCLGAYDHQEVPFEKLVSDLQREQGGRAPLLQSTFTLHDPQIATLELEGATVLPFGVATTATKFDLALFTEESARGLRTAFEYRTELFDPETIDRMLGHYRTVLDAMVGDPRTRVSKLALLPAEELAALVGDRRATLPGYRADLLVADLVAEQAALTPNAIAVEAEGEGSGRLTLTYADLESRSNQVAWELRRLGVGSDVPVALFLERTPSLIVALLAVLKAGGAYLPLDPAFPAERLQFMLDDAVPKVIVTEERLRPQLPGIAVPRLSLDGDAGRIAAHPRDRPPEAATGPDHLAYILYTSGSTGRPKGVMVSHAAISHHTQWIRSLCSFGVGDTVLQKTPVTFDPSGLEIYLALTTGARLFLARPGGEHDLEYVLDVMRRERVSMVIFIPSALAASVHLPLFADACSTLRLIISGGEVLTSELASRTVACAPHGALFNLYGPTEATIAATAWPFRGNEPPGPLPIGRPLPDLRAYLVDRNGEAVPIGVAGELCLAGVQTARGYLNRPETTADRFVPDPFVGKRDAIMYRTGDRARWRRDGVLEFLGRVDEQVKLRGYRIELEEIEAVLASHPAVAEAAVVVREDVPGNKRLVAYVTTIPGNSLTALELREHARRNLPDYMVPSAVMALDQLPLNANGKLDRDVLPVPDGAEVGTEYVAPRTEIEGVLAEVWSEVLAVARVGVNDDFFDLGGHSLLALRIFSRLVDRLHVRLPLRMIFEAPTVGKLAERIASARPGTAVHDPDPIERVGDEAPASFAQEVLWLLQRSDPDLSAYNMADAWTVDGVLNVAAFRQALRALVERQAAFRTTFHAGGDGTVQRIAPAGDVALETIDLRQTPASDRDVEAANLAHVRARLPFNLASDLLLRASLIQLDDDRCVLTLVTHHIVSDGWSRGVVIRELSALYDAFASSTGAALPPLPVRFIDYAAWQRERLRGDLFREHVEYWTQRLAGATLDVGVMTDRPRVHEKTFAGANASRLLSPELLAGLQAMAREYDATLFMVLLAAYQTLLYRYSAQEDLVVGTIVAGRPRADLEPLVGYFVNTLPIRTSFAGNPTFAEVLARVREAYLGASEHAEVPFQQLVQALPRGEGAVGVPVCQAMFVLQNNAPASLRLGSATVRAMAAGLGAAKFDVMLAIGEQARGLRASMQYRPELFDAATIERLLRHLGSLLASVVAAPCTPVNSIPLLDATEREQLLREWNRTAVDVPATTIHGLFAAQAARTPDAVAVVHRSEEMTYAELDARARALAGRLRAFGVGREVLVGVCLPRSPDLVVALLGVMMAGGAYLPLDPAYPRERIAFMLTDVHALLMLTTEQLAPELPEVPGTRTICLDRIDASVPPAPVGDTHLEAELDNLAYVIYTSGSTGTPKGVGIEHRNAVAFLAWATSVFSPHEVAGVLASTSVCFDLSIFEMFAPLSVGGALVIVENVLELAWLRSPHPVTLVNTVPSAMTELLRSGTFPATVRTVNLAGEPLTTSLVRDLYALGTLDRVFDLYGPSETTTYSTFALRTVDGPATIGRPIANTFVYVLDPRGAPNPIGVPGELCIGGAGVARGYLGRPELTAERFVPDPFAPSAGGRMYRTGDLARWRNDGTLEYLGRMDSQVKLRGHRIELGEIEAILMQQPGVDAALAMIREDTAGDRRLAAYIVTGGSADPSAATLRGCLRAKLPAVMVPSAFIFLDRFPLTPNNKIDRKALPVPEAETAAVGPNYVVPRAPVEQEIAALWAALLGVERVGTNDDFFDLGGTSLLAMRMIAEIERIWDRRLPFRLLLEHPTVAQVATIIRSALSADEERGVVVLQEGGPGTPLVFVHGDILGYGWYCRRLASLLGPAPLVVVQTYGQNAPITFEEMAAANIAALKRFQPAGPYRLGGFCQGGLIAYEMARQLVAGGERVDRVIAVDALCPNTRLLALEPLVQLRSWSRDPVARLERRANIHLRLHYYRRRIVQVLGMEPTTRGDWVRGVFCRLLGLRRPAVPSPVGSASPVGTGSDDAAAQEELERVAKFRFVRRAQRGYMPGRYGGRVDVILAAEVFNRRPWTRRGAGLERVANMVRVHTVNGTHDGLIAPAGLPLLAEQIRRCLDP